MANSPKQSVAIVGLGYVGLCSAVVFADRGVRVKGLEIDKERLREISRGVPPIHEPGLAGLLKKALKRGLLSLTSSYDEALRDSTMVFITVGTPSRPNGAIDLRYVRAAAASIGKSLRTLDYRLVVVKSTVLPGTTDGSVKTILEETSGKEAGAGFGLCANPEFLREGSAIWDSFHQSTVLIGSSDPTSVGALKGFYSRLNLGKSRMLLTSATNAEFIKYTVNAYRAVSLSFLNTIANICSRTPGGDIGSVARGLVDIAKLDTRYAKAGLGFGGSCLPPWTRVVTSQGFKEISEIRVGDKVLSHDGYYHPVSRTFTRPYDGDIYAIRGQGQATLMATPEHPIWTSKRLSPPTRYQLISASSGRQILKLRNALGRESLDFAVPAQISHGDYLAFPMYRPLVSHLPVLEFVSVRKKISHLVTEDLMFLIGLYVAEGSRRDRHGVAFALHRKEQFLAREITRISYFYFGTKAVVKRNHRGGNGVLVEVDSSPFARFLLDTIGSGAAKKRVPWDWLDMPDPILVALLRGIWYGDGSSRGGTKRYGRFVLGMTSREIIDFVSVAFLRLGIPFRRLRSPKHVGRDGVQHRECYYIMGCDSAIMRTYFPELLTQGFAKQRHRTSWYEDGVLLCPIKKIGTVRYQGTVHNLAVDVAESYVTEGGTVHNCLPKDTRALLARARELGEDAEMLESALRVNERQAVRPVKMAIELAGPLKDKKVTLLGLTFKANSDDLRESRAMLIARRLVEEGAVVTVYDPQGMSKAAEILGTQVRYGTSAKASLKGAECCIIGTDWDEFRLLTPRDYKRLMATPVLVDGRRLYRPASFAKEGVPYARIGSAD